DQVSVGYVLVPVVVRTRGGYANHLKAQDFHLLVDDRPVKIESFEERAEAPASLVFLQDLSGSMETGGKVEISRQVVSYFLGKALPGDEFALATFASGQGQVEVPFTTDTGTVREAITLWKGYGTTALHDAVAWIPEITMEGHNSKRFAILVTDGLDNASQIDPAAAREIVRAAQVPVYVLGLESGNPYELLATGGKLYRYADVLNLLAIATGGRYYPINHPGDLAKALGDISADLRHQYVLGFATSGSGASAWRKLQVEVRGSSRIILFRHGYKGPPPSGTSRGG
nr:VWA domain-containing protein [Acidobacteriota bacterium]